MRKIILLGIAIITFVGCQTEELQHPRVVSEAGKSYLVQDSLRIITHDGATISAIVVRDQAAKERLPAILFHTIYPRPQRDLAHAMKAAAAGYVGVVTYSRGKGLSTDKIEPYDHEADDTYEVIDWISDQKWSDGQVGMYGGSYNGFTQWAATKKLHPALKTIVPSAAAAPGIAEPMENGVVANFFYPWPHYVGNNPYLDTTLYNDYERWRNLNLGWYEMGVAYRALDSLDGLPNPVFRKWLDHPTYDAYWQNMVPYQEDFAKINIPVLTTTGYFDGGQIGALYYLKEHYKYNPQAEHYLVIGPYTHLGAQGTPLAEVGGYTIGAAAQISITELTFEWFDFVFKGAPKPEILKDRINHQVMGTNQWNHAPSLEAIATDTLTFYLSKAASDFTGPVYGTSEGALDHFTLNGMLSRQRDSIVQHIDFADRSGEGQNNYYTPLVISDTLTVGNGIVFASRPLPKDFEINGAYFGQLKAKINKKDFDFSTVLYEQTSDGQFFKLTLRNIARASLAKDRTERHLLEPGEIETLPLAAGRMTSKWINRGSRLILVLNGNKHPFDQINYGTGEDVSAETIEDAQDPLEITWYSDSFIKVPITRYRGF